MYKIQQHNIFYNQILKAQNEWKKLFEKLRLYCFKLYTNPFKIYVESQVFYL